MAGAYSAPIFCDGELVDNLEAPEGDEGLENLYAHATAHIKDGKLVWCIVHAKGTFKSQLTGETYKINEIDKPTFDENEEMTFICPNACKGRYGTHVIMFFNIDLLLKLSTCKRRFVRKVMMNKF